MVPDKLTRSDLLMEIRTRVKYIAEDRRKELNKFLMYMGIQWLIFFLGKVLATKGSEWMLILLYTVFVAIITLAMCALYNFVMFFREELKLTTLLNRHEVTPVECLDENDNLLAKSLYLANLGRVYTKKLKKRKRK